MTDAERTLDAMRTAFASLYALFDEARYERRDGYDFLFLPDIPLALFNGVWPLEDAAASELEPALAEIEAAGVPCSVQLRDQTTPACETEARRVGLTSELALPAMAVRTADLSEPAVDGCSVAPVATNGDRVLAMETAAAGFGAPLWIFEPIYRERVLAADGVRVYLARTGDDVVATAIGYTIGDAVGIFNVATPAAHRGRGYGAAVTAAAVRDGFDAGAELAWLQASELGFSVYRRLGFEQVATDRLLTR
ncbi:MAG TPA: GNAT family N-acetyltransferase [Gaiellaceae bacterium]